MLDKKQKNLRNLLGYSWFQQLEGVITSDEMKATAKRVNARRKTPDINVYPAKEDTFKALRLCSFEDTKVVIIGADPHHEVGVADGLAFSSQDPFTILPAQTAIFKEITDTVYDGDKDHLHERSLVRWANQGVLLLNTILSVEEGKALSHEKLGWQQLTSQILIKLLQDEEPKVFLCWGLAAQATLEQAVVDALGPEKPLVHAVLQTSHPTATEGFEGCDHFNLANEFLKEQQGFTVNW